jgi:ligand-binding sensor domain-containing protein/two-component sensor histidine kinase
MKTIAFLGVSFLLLLLGNSWGSYAQTQKLRFEHITTDMGLPDNTAICSMQDSKGFLWFGTYNGLCKYDGYSFITYQFDPNDTTSIGGNLITRIFEDSSGLIWVIVRGTGIFIFDRTTEKFTRFNPKSDFLSPNYTSSWALNEDKEGKIWTGNDHDGQLIRYDKKTSALDIFTDSIFAKQDANTKENRGISTIYKDKYGALWIGSTNGLHRLNLISQGQGKSSRISFTPYLHDPNNNRSLAGNNINSIYEDSTGKLWVTGDGIINLLDPRSGACNKRFIPDPKNPHAIYSNDISNITLDKEGSLWVGAANVLHKLNKERTSFTRYIHDPNDPASLNGNKFFKLFIDNSNILWLSTLGGLDKVDLNQKAIALYRHNPSNIHSLSNNNVSAICEDKTGIVWLGTIGGGLNAWNKHTNIFTHYRDNPSKWGSIGSDFITAILEDREGNLWIGGGKNSIGILSRLDRKTGTFKNHSFILTFETTYGNPVLTLYEDRQGFIWVGSTGGVSRFNPKTETWVHYPYDPKKPEGISDYWTNTICEDNSGNFWLGHGSYALDKLDPKTGKITHYTHHPNDTTSISSSAVKSIFKDSKGTLWFATRYGGLCRLNEANETFTSFTKRDGLPSNTIYSILEDDEGSLWLTTNKGICRFNPSTRTFTNLDKDDGLQGNQFEIRVENVGGCYKGKDGTLYFGGPNGFNVFHPHDLHVNTSVPPVVITRFSLFNKPVPGKNEAKQIELNHDQNFFSFEFAALNYSSPVKNQYAYRLVGIDKDWVYSGQQRLANYTSIAPGTYVFKVKASNNDGIWNEKGTSVTIIIYPPWWKTWWAYLLWSVIIVALLYSIYYVRISRLKELLQVRNNIAHDLHDDVGSTLSSISIMSEMAKRKTPESSVLLEKIGSNAQQMQENMSDIVWAINPKNDRFEDVLKRMKMFASEMLEIKNISLHFCAEEALYHVKPSMSQRRNLYFVFKEAITNTAKYAAATNVMVKVSLQNRMIELLVKDDGKGFDAAYQTMGGNGLYNMQKRAEELNGTLKIDSIKGTGTAIYLQFKIT